MNKRFYAAAEEKEVVIDITPMLDVVFILLIFFIVTASFLQEAGFDLPSPGPVTEPLEASENIMIEIMPDDRTLVRGRDVDIRRIAANVQRLRSERPDAVVVIKASKRSKNNTLVQVMDNIHAAGVHDLSIAESSQ